ncbi:hypothetical protein SAMN02982929_07187 [Saccharopolyspora kobensis]|uniref:Uncharacterized protein n=1 Tax=Saccharopolyspora kobensis TaxID=146035 RepID=A0A1H6EPS3_9PSEU|nr:hypothetical protein [Saccharopolyspora kobensis]SEG98694.1 hypothetical protein SAMN02982929_07187 [Saccharopolyspora kobensis]SFD23762.1 hypothetical protein SAMN05216506_103182 [Saccharopolyspora kobensis]
MFPPEVRIEGPLGSRTVTVGGVEIPAVEAVSVSEAVHDLQRVTITVLTDRATIAFPER